MDVLEVEGMHGPLTNLVVSVWKDEEGRYRIILDNPKVNKWIVVTLDVRSLIREAVRLN